MGTHYEKTLYLRLLSPVTAGLSSCERPAEPEISPSGSFQESRPPAPRPRGQCNTPKACAAGAVFPVETGVFSQPMLGRRGSTLSLLVSVLGGSAWTPFRSFYAISPGATAPPYSERLSAPPFSGLVCSAVHAPFQSVHTDATVRFGHHQPAVLALGKDTRAPAWPPPSARSPGQCRLRPLLRAGGPTEPFARRRLCASVGGFTSRRPPGASVWVAERGRPLRATVGCKGREKGVRSAQTPSTSAGRGAGLQRGRGGSAAGPAPALPALPPRPGPGGLRGPGAGAPRVSTGRPGRDGPRRALAGTLLAPARCEAGRLSSGRLGDGDGGPRAQHVAAPGPAPALALSGPPPARRRPRRGARPAGFRPAPPLPRTCERRHGGRRGRVRDPRRAAA